VFDSWDLHESEIQVQGNQRLFSLATSQLAVHRFVKRRKIKKTLWDLGNFTKKSAHSP